MSSVQSAPNDKIPWRQLGQQQTATARQSLDDVLGFSIAPDVVLNKQAREERYLEKIGLQSQN